MATQKKDEQLDTLESSVRQVVAKGTDVQAAVHKLTLDAMSNHTLSLESIGRIMHAVVQGTREGVQEELDKTKAQASVAQARMKEAVSGLDAALTQFAAATKLALEAKIFQPGYGANPRRPGKPGSTVSGNLENLCCSNARASLGHAVRYRQPCPTHRHRRG